MNSNQPSENYLDLKNAIEKLGTFAMESYKKYKIDDIFATLRVNNIYDFTCLVSGGNVYIGVLDKKQCKIITSINLDEFFLSDDIVFQLMYRLENNYQYTLKHGRLHHLKVENAWINYCIERNVINIPQFYAEEIISDKTETRDDDLDMCL